MVSADPDGNPMMANLRTQPFGRRRAPANWARVATFLQFVKREIFVLWIGVFVDDCFRAESQSTIASSLWVVRELCSLLGLELAHPKEQPPCDVIDLLGATVRFGRNEVTAELTKLKRNEYVAFLKNVIRKNNLRPAMAAKIM